MLRLVLLQLHLAFWITISQYVRIAFVEVVAGTIELCPLVEAVFVLSQPAVVVGRELVTLAQREAESAHFGLPL